MGTTFGFHKKCLNFLTSILESVYTWSHPQLAFAISIYIYKIIVNVDLKTTRAELILGTCQWQSLPFPLPLPCLITVNRLLNN